MEILPPNVIRRLLACLAAGMALAPAACAAEPPPGLPLAVAPAATDAPVTWLRQLPTRTARRRGVPRLEPIDGLDSTALPLPDRHAVEVEFTRSFSTSYVELDGTGSFALRDGERLLQAGLPAGARACPPRETRLRRVAVCPEAQGASLAEARFYQVAPAPRPEGALPFSAAAPGADALVLSTIPIEDATGVTAVVLDLEIGAAAVLRVRLELASEPGRAWLQADLAPTGAGRLSLVLDPPDAWCEGGDRVILSLSSVARHPSSVLSHQSPAIGHRSPGIGHPASIVRAAAAAVTAPADAVRDEFVLSRLNWFAAWYRDHAAEAPWEREDWDPAREPAARWLDTLRRWLPRHPGVMAYAARVQRVPFQPPVNASGAATAPAWAVYAHHLLKQTQGIAYWWRASRHQPDGLYGGDAGADAALVETLAGSALITGEGVMLRSLEQDVEATWKRAEAPAGPALSVAEWARPTALTLPLLLLLRPDSPVPVERCLQASRRQEAWTAVNAQGHRHFRSSGILPADLAPDPGTAADVPLNALAAAPAFAVAWHSGHPALRRTLGEWAGAWAADLGAVEDPPEGAPPFLALDPRTCRPVDPAPASPAWLPAPEALSRLLLDAYDLTGDAAVLRAATRSVRDGWSGPLAAAIWRSLGSAKMDARLTQWGQDENEELRAYAAWQATGNKQFVVDGLRAACVRLEKERYLLTEAHPPPDTVRIPGDLLLRFLYLGGPGAWRGGMPRLAVTWEETGADFAAFVAESRPDRLKVLAYHFRPQDRPVRMRVWGLRAGTYLLAAGPDDNYDDSPDRFSVQRAVEVERGEAIPLVLPAQQPLVVTLSARKLRPAAPEPDLALGAEDVALSRDRLSVAVTLHNIGAAPAVGARVTVTDDRRQELGAAVVGEVGWPETLAPATRQVVVPLARPATPRYRVTASCSGAEITRANNSVAMSASAVSSRE